MRNEGAEEERENEMLPIMAIYFKHTQGKRRRRMMMTGGMEEHNTKKKNCKHTIAEGGFLG